MSPPESAGNAREAPPPLEIFLAVPPGLEPILLDEARAKGFAEPVATEGGVTIRGGWREVWRANLQLRGASRVLARIAEFRALHLAQLDRRARKVPWAAYLPPHAPVQVEATCRKSRIYHAGAAASRVEAALRAALGPPQPQAPQPRTEPAVHLPETGDEAALTVRVRIEDDLCTISLDTSGAPLHRRGFKQAVAKAPLRETLAALFLRAAGYDGAMPLLDPMCGAGTFVLEAAEIAAGLAPGRGRAFAFERLPSFDPSGWDALRDDLRAGVREAPPPIRCVGLDRDAGAIAAARGNAARAGLASAVTFEQAKIGALVLPEALAGQGPGLVAVNPPYGGRIGAKKALFGLYATLGERLRAHFPGWRVALVTSEPALARATGLPFGPPGPPVPHGGLRVRLWTASRLD